MYIKGNELLTHFWCFTRIYLVNQSLVNHFLADLDTERHFEALRQFLLLQDGEFAQSLSDQLFEKVWQGRTDGRGVPHVSVPGFLQSLNLYFMVFILSDHFKV